VGGGGSGEVKLLNGSTALLSAQRILVSPLLVLRQGRRAVTK